jgi:hypothetical protein
MKTFRKIILAGLFFYLPLASMAWGMEGHRIVGEIADSYLTPKARLSLQHILGTQSIAMASNWADFIKSDTSFKYLNDWHYINLKDGLTYNEVKNQLAADTSADVYTKINFLVKELKNKQLPKDKQVFYLRLLIHLVGDVHQPMHVSREEDLGGSKIKVLWFEQFSNLHSIWDASIINYQQLSYTEYAKAVNHTTPTQRVTWQKQPVSDWVYESYQISQQLYKEIKQPNQKLGYQYDFDHIETLNAQLLKGGVRLAGVLNEIFG